MRFIVAAAAFLQMSAQANAQTDGNTMLEACTSQEDTMRGFCAGYVIGAIEGLVYGVSVPMMFGDESVQTINETAYALLMFCPPDGTINRQYIDIFIRHLQEHPETRNFPARGLALASFQEAWPCY